MPRLVDRLSNSTIVYGTAAIKGAEIGITVGATLLNPVLGAATATSILYAEKMIQSHQEQRDGQSARPLRAILHGIAVGSPIGTALRYTPIGAIPTRLNPVLGGVWGAVEIAYNAIDQGVRFVDTGKAVAGWGSRRGKTKTQIA